MRPLLRKLDGRYSPLENFGISVVRDNKERRVVCQTWSYKDALTIAEALNGFRHAKKTKRRKREIIYNGKYEHDLRKAEAFKALKRGEVSDEHSTNWPGSPDNPYAHLPLEEHARLVDDRLRMDWLEKQFIYITLYDDDIVPTLLGTVLSVSTGEHQPFRTFIDELMRKEDKP